MMNGGVDATAHVQQEAVEQQVVAVDMDGTVISGDSQTLASMLLVRRGMLPVHAPLGAIAWVLGARLGLPEVDAEALQQKTVRSLAGQQDSKLSQACNDLVERRLKPAIRAQARAVVAEWQRQGAFVVLASASFAQLVAPVAEAIGADDYVATRMAPPCDGRITGQMATRRMSGTQKRDAVEAAMSARFPRWRLVAAYSDHISDLPLLERAERSVAVTPSRQLRRHAEAVGWKIENWR